MTPPPPSDAVLVRYLLGMLPQAEIEALDERSVADDLLAQRLEAIENDLVDRYAHGELADDMRHRFEAQYLTTARGRQKVRFAEALSKKDAAAATAAPAARVVLPRWLLAAAAVLVVVIGSFLIVEQSRDGEVPPASEIVRQPDTVPPAAPPSPEAAPPAAPSPDAARPEPLVVAFTLAAARRGIAEPPAIAVPPNATAVLLRLELEGDDFPEYAVIVKDAATGRVVHEAAGLRSRAFANSSIVPVIIPAASLPAAHGSVELVGRSPGQPVEPLSTYPFRVTAR